MRSPKQVCIPVQSDVSMLIPSADKNLDFFLGHLFNQFGEGRKVWEENRHHDVGARTKEQLEAYYFTA